MADLKRAALAVAIAFALYAIIFHSSPLGFLSGPGYRRMVPQPKHLYWLPVLWIACLGAVGIAVTYAIARNKAWRMPWGVPLVFALVAFNFVIVDGEVKRHYSIALSALALAFLVSVPWSAGLRALLIAGAAIALVAHGHFLYRYLSGPNELAGAPSLKPYLCLNEYLAANPLPVIAASAPLRFPLALRVTTATPPNSEDVLVHSRISADTFRVIGTRGTDYGKAQALGYRAIIVGPLERKAFSPDVLKLAQPSKLLKDCGEAKLYALP